LVALLPDGRDMLDVRSHLRAGKQQMEPMKPMSGGEKWWPDDLGQPVIERIAERDATRLFF
jgi:hypothetical protein